MKGSINLGFSSKYQEVLLFGTHNISRLFQVIHLNQSTLAAVNDANNYMDLKTHCQHAYAKTLTMNYFSTET